MQCEIWALLEHHHWSVKACYERRLAELGFAPADIDAEEEADEEDEDFDPLAYHASPADIEKKKENDKAD